MNNVPVIYALGCGCWCHNGIPECLRSPSVFQQGGSRRSDIFLPQTIFDGRLQKSFFNRDAWKLTISPHQPKDNQAIYDVQFDNVELGFRYGHINVNPHFAISVNNIKNAESRFKFFEGNKYKQLFVIDFSRGAYQGYTRRMVLDFEKYLQENGFDLENFIYCDTDVRQVPDRFDGCRCKVFSYDKDYVKRCLGIELVKCVKVMFKENKEYIVDQVRRISGDNQLSY